MPGYATVYRLYTKGECALPGALGGEGILYESYRGDDHAGDSDRGGDVPLRVAQAGELGHVNASGVISARLGVIEGFELSVGLDRGGVVILYRLPSCTANPVVSIRINRGSALAV